jgi:hypothetical protein
VHLESNYKMQTKKNLVNIWIQFSLRASLPQPGPFENAASPAEALTVPQVAVAAREMIGWLIPSINTALCDNELECSAT